MSDRGKPKWLDNPNYGKVTKSKKHENRVAKTLGGKRLPQSGAKRWSKWDAETANGDISAPTLHVEHKRTECESMSLKMEWLEKVSRGARAVGKDPALVLTFEEAKSFPMDWCMVPLDVFLQLQKLAEAREEEE